MYRFSILFPNILHKYDPQVLCQAHFLPLLRFSRQMSWRAVPQNMSCWLMPFILCTGYSFFLNTLPLSTPFQSFSLSVELGNIWLTRRTSAKLSRRIPHSEAPWIICLPQPLPNPSWVRASRQFPSHASHSFLIIIVVTFTDLSLHSRHCAKLFIYLISLHYPNSPMREYYYNTSYNMITPITMRYNNFSHSWKNGGTHWLPVHELCSMWIKQSLEYLFNCVLQ